LEGRAHGLIEVLIAEFGWRKEKHHRKPQSGHRESWTRFETGIFWT